MKITTPTATLGIRGTTGLVEVPEGAAANNPNNVAVKLYPDADGRVGRIEVNDRAGARLGFLTQGASGFTIRPGAGGARFAAVPLAIPQAVMLRDQGFVRQLHSTQNVGRQLVFQQREFRRANPGFVNPNRPIRQFQPGQQRPNGLPGQNTARTTAAAWSVEPSRPAAAERPARATRSAATADRAEPPGQQQPGQLNRPGQPQQPGTPPRAGQQQPGSPNQPGLPPRAGQPSRPGLPAQPGLPPRAGQPPRSDLPPQPAAPRGTARTAATGSACPGCSALPGVQGAPAVQRPGLPAAPRRPRPRRNAASRRQGAALVAKMASGIAPQPVAQLLHEASRLLSRSTLHRVDGHRLYLQRK